MKEANALQFKGYQRAKKKGNRRLLDEYHSLIVESYVQGLLRIKRG